MTEQRVSGWSRSFRKVVICLVHLLASPLLAAPLDAVPYGVNLIANPGAEAGSGSPTGEQVPVPGWTTTGTFTVVPWGAFDGRYPSNSSPGPPDRGANFFAGGNGAQISTATQEIDVSENAAEINQGTIVYEMSGWFGGTGNQRDAAHLRVTFFNGTEHLADAIVGRVTFTERNSVTGLLFRGGSGAVPPNTTRIVLTQIMARSATFPQENPNDGYADSLSFVLRQRSAPPAVLNARFAGNGTRLDASGPWSGTTRWTPSEVPNNTADKLYNVTITGVTLSAKLSNEDRVISRRFGSVRLDIDATINDLTLESGGFQNNTSGFPAELGRERSLSVLGATRDLSRQGVTILNAEFDNTGFTLRANESDSVLTLGTFLNFSGGTLASTALRLSGYGGGAIVRFRDADIVKLESTIITLDGGGSQVQDYNGNDALRRLSHIDAGSSFSVRDHTRAFEGDLTADGSIAVRAAVASAGISAVGVLTNFDPATRTLRNGNLSVGDDAEGTASLECFLRFDGIDIVNNAGSISLTGPGARIVDQNGADALRNFAHNQAGADFNLSARDFTTAGAFTNEGRLFITSFPRSGTFTVTGPLTNFDPATGTLSGGRFEVFGFSGSPNFPATDGRIIFPGANIVHNRAELRLGTRGAIVDENGNNALRNFTDNQSGGLFELAGSAFAAPSGFFNAGAVFIFNFSEVFSVAPGHSYIQTAGETVLGGSVLTADTVLIQGGILHRGGTINGNVIVERGTISPTGAGGGGIANFGGFLLLVPSSGGIPGPDKMTINGNLELHPDAHYSMVIRGTPDGEFDTMVVSGNATFGGTFEVELLNNFVPAPSDSFTVLTAGAPIAGAFVNVPSGTRIPTKDGRASFIATYSDNKLVLSNPEVAPPAQLLNISTRLRVLTGENVLIGGFIVTGAEAKRVIVRAIGPSLTSLGVNGALENPTLELFGGAGEPIAFNDNWKESQQDEIEATTIPPVNDAESAIVRTLQPGNYTAIVRGKNDGTGIGLVEVYDLAQGAASRLANISSRGFVDVGDNVLIGGFIVGGSSGGARAVVRAIGPSLSAAGINGPLQDPTLALVNAQGAIIQANDDWKQSQQTELEAIGLQPTDDRESALIQTLAAGNYTAVLRGKNNTTGVAVVEVYNVP